MTKTTGPSGTRALVAPELLPSLDAFPKFELNEAMLPVVRGGGGGRERMIQPPLSAEQQVVRCEQRFAPGAFHGFGVAGADSPQVQALLRWRREALARAFS